jgi:hypothetical protein
MPASSPATARDGRVYDTAQCAMLIAPYALVNMCIAAALPGMNAVLR